MQCADLKDKTIVLTGGANGIGEAMVRAFHQQGAQVAFGDRDAAAGKALAVELGERASFAPVDLRREKAVKQWIHRIGKRQGRIDVLINNAAIDPRIAFDRMTSGEWDHIFSVNLRAYFFCAQAALPWIPRGGAIINFSSITAHTSPTEMSAYVATKTGILGLTRSLARELGPRGIRVNAISPGWIMTERQLKQYVTPSVKRLIKESQCIPDLLQPKEIAQVALFLASQASSALTGQELLADRGWAFS